MSEQNVTLAPQEILHTQEGITVSVSTQVEQTDRAALWNMVETGFMDLNRRSYERQDMTHEEFEADLDSQHVLKYVARDKEQNPIGVLTVHVGLDDITWTNTSRLAEAQRQVDERAVPYYVGTLVVPPDMRGTDTASYLVKASFVHFKQVNQATNQNSLVFFDCAHGNYPWLGEFVQKVGSPDDEYPDIKTTVSELYEEYWLASGDGSPAVKAMQPQPGQEVLDSQHHYAISIHTES